MIVKIWLCEGKEVPTIHGCGKLIRRIITSNVCERLRRTLPRVGELCEESTA